MLVDLKVRFRAQSRGAIYIQGFSPTAKLPKLLFRSPCPLFRGTASLGKPLLHNAPCAGVSSRRVPLLSLLLPISAGLSLRSLCAVQFFFDMSSASGCVGKKCVQEKLLKVTGLRLQGLQVRSLYL